MGSARARWLWLLAPVPLVGLVRVGGGYVPPRGGPRAGERPTLAPSTFSEAPLERPLRLLFIHHSVGGQLLADRGPDDGAASILRSSVNGGGLRRALEAHGFEVHEASYGSRIGDRTDLADFVETFGDRMDAVLATTHQDRRYGDGGRNDVVLFKSCYPANDFVAEGEPPGDPRSYQRTVANARASLRALLPAFRRHPDVLFVYLTAPPMAPRAPGVRLWRWPYERLRGRVVDEARMRRRSRLARGFADWVVSPDGWLRDYPERNVAAFDYYDVLTGDGRTDLSAYPTHDGFDAHPSREGQTEAARRLVPFLARAVRRAELLDSTVPGGHHRQPSRE